MEVGEKERTLDEMEGDDMKNSESSGVSLREFARQVGKSPTWISKLVKEGKLPRNDDGSIPVEEGFKAYDRLNEKKTKTHEELPESDDAPIDEGLAKSMNVAQAFNKARLAEKTYQAKLKELEYKLKQGELVERDKVIADAESVGALLREQLMSLPVRYSGLCEGRTARDIEEILEDAINDALKSLQKSEFIH